MIECCDRKHLSMCSERNKRGFKGSVCLESAGSRKGPCLKAKLFTPVLNGRTQTQGKTACCQHTHFFWRWPGSDALTRPNKYFIRNIVNLCCGRFDTGSSETIKYKSVWVTHESRDLYQMHYTVLSNITAENHHSKYSDMQPVTAWCYSRASSKCAFLTLS